MKKMKYDERRNEWVAMTRTERVVETVVEAVCAVLAFAAFTLSAWLWLYATPDQRTAECDLIYAQMEAAGVL